MILYATKQTIKELNIPMPNELSTFNNIMANKVIEEQTGDELLEWGLKLFYFDCSSFNSAPDSISQSLNSL